MKKYYPLKSNQVILIGDTHSLPTLQRLLRRIPDGSLVYMVGDVGIGFGVKDYVIASDNMIISEINNFCQLHDIHLYIGIGNHDAPYPEIWDQHYSNVILTKSGDVGIFPNGKKVLFIGGGISLDRKTRTEGYDYWKDEITPHLTDIEKCDVVFSHDCPEELNLGTSSLHRSFTWYVERDPTLIEDALRQRTNMTRIVKESGASRIYYGHFHNTIEQTIDGLYGRCININEMYMVDADQF